MGLAHPLSALYRLRFMDTDALTQLAVLLALATIPFAVLVATSFTKISVVLSLLRSALGTAQVPSGAIVTALAVLMSLYVMAPVGKEIAEVAAAPASQISTSRPFLGESWDAVVATFDAGKDPLISFLTRNSDEGDRDLFVDLARRSGSEDAASGDLLVVLPAFLVTELGEAFLIGFLLCVPFLVVDLIVSNVLMSLGMHMLSPTAISLPLKLLLFVAVDGWYVLTEALVTGYA